jgi:hypothetical protein
MRKLLASALLVAVLGTGAQAQETIYMLPNSTMAYHSKAPFKRLFNSNDALLVVEPITDRDVIITAKEPETTILASTNLLFLDAQNKTETLRVVVTPFGGPHITMHINNVTHVCAMRCIPLAKADKNGIGDADSLSIIRTWRK